MKNEQRPHEDSADQAPQPYLAGDFSKELSYQLWVTKGARFHACRRLQTKQQWSTYSIAALAFYAITANLVPAYGVAGKASASPTMAFVSSALSILIIIISLLEGSRQYDLRADKHHRCGLELAKLYRELRQLRTGPLGTSDAAIAPDTLISIKERYEAILDRHENHENVDFLLQKAEKSEWFRSSCLARCWIRMRWYLQVSFLYHVAILLPPFAYLWLWLRAAPTP